MEEEKSSKSGGIIYSCAQIVGYFWSGCSIMRNLSQVCNNKAVGWLVNGGDSEEYNSEKWRLLTSCTRK